MECTPEQIEEKRRLAVAKLQARKLQQTSNSFNDSLQNSGNNLNVSSSKGSSFNQNQSPRYSNSSNTSNSNSPFSPFKNNGEQNRNNYNPKVPSSFHNKTHNNNSPYSKTTISLEKFFGKTITGTMALISESRFEVQLSGFHERAIEVFKSIPSKAYDGKTKIWNFDVQDYKMLVSKFQQLRPEVVVGAIPSFVFKALDDQKRYLYDIDFSKIDPELTNTLMPFQREGVIFGVNCRGRLLIADDMGLGKTFQALAIAHYYKDDWPLLIATTASMRHTWQETIQKYLPSVPLMHVQYMTSGKDYIQDAKVLIVSRDMLSRYIDKMMEKNFGVIIVDESHEFKNFKTKCAQSATQLSKKAKRIILLSGTPALSRPSELYTQLSLIDERFFGNFIEYSKRYCDGKTTNFGWDSSGKSNLAELEVILSKKFMIRRTKNDVLQALPSKTREAIKLDLSLSQMSEEEMKCLDQLILQYNATKKGQEKHTALLTLFGETAKIKIPSVCKYILNILQEKTKFLVFAHHQKMLDAVSSVLKKSNIDYIRIDGNTTNDQRKYFIDKFQFNDNCMCAVLSITAANAGITLTAAQLVLFAELHWNPSILSQAESRAHRIGQQNEVQVRYLLAEGTADDYIWPMLLEKQNVLNEAGLTNDSFREVHISVQEKAEKPNTALESWLQKKEAKMEAQNKALENWLQKPEPKDEEVPNSLLQDDNDDLFLDIDCPF